MTREQACSAPPSSSLNPHTRHYTFSDRSLLPNSRQQKGTRGRKAPFISPVFFTSQGALFPSLNSEERLAHVKLCGANWVATGIRTRVTEAGGERVRALTVAGERQSTLPFVDHLRPVTHTERHAHASAPLSRSANGRQARGNSPAERQTTIRVSVCVFTSTRSKRAGDDECTCDGSHCSLHVQQRVQNTRTMEHIRVLWRLNFLYPFCLLLLFAMSISSSGFFSSHSTRPIDQTEETR